MADAPGPQYRLPLRIWLALVLGGAGAALLVLGWWTISGESSVADQMPYLASATIPGAALVVAAAIVLAGARPDPRSAQLYDLLTEAVSAPPAAEPTAPDRLVTVAGTAHYHRSACALVTGKTTEAVDEVDGLEPCPVCRPIHP